MPPKAITGKAKATPKRKASEATTPDVETPGAETPDANTKKRKVDWATIDDKKPFAGFKLVPPTKTKAGKKTKPSRKKQKTGNSAGAADRWKDAPMGANIVQENPYSEGVLSETHYQVKPALEWESTNRYRRFTSKSSLH